MKLRPEDATGSMSNAPDAAERRLLDFLQHHDASCPLCGYNLRQLTQPRCPECNQELRLRVGLRRLRLGYLLATLTPMTFSGICAALLLLPMGASSMFGGGPLPWQVIALDLFGWMSGFGAVGLLVCRHAFLRLTLRTQRLWAAIVWALHIAAFLLLVLSVM